MKNVFKKGKVFVFKMHIEGIKELILFEQKVLVLIVYIMFVQKKYV